MSIVIRDKLFKAFDEKFLRLWKSRDFCDIWEVGPEWVESLEISGIVLSSRGGAEPILDSYTLRVARTVTRKPPPPSPAQLYLYVPKDLRDKILVLGFVP